jgi:hypothetical protein
MMDPKNLNKQMVDFCKTNFDNSFATLMMLQEQMERMGNLFWGQVLNVPEEAKKGLSEWTKTQKKNCDNFKKAVDEGFKNLEALAA